MGGIKSSTIKRKQTLNKQEYLANFIGLNGVKYEELEKLTVIKRFLIEEWA